MDISASNYVSNYVLKVYSVHLYVIFRLLLKKTTSFRAIQYPRWPSLPPIWPRHVKSPTLIEVYPYSQWNIVTFPSDLKFKMAALVFEQPKHLSFFLRNYWMPNHQKYSSRSPLEILLLFREILNPRCLHLHYKLLSQNN